VNFWAIPARTAGWPPRTFRPASGDMEHLCDTSILQSSVSWMHLPASRVASTSSWSRSRTTTSS